MPPDAPRAPASPWLRGPIWDAALVAFPWVPVWAWIVFGLRLGAGGEPIASSPAFATALVFVLALTFLHRQYVFLLVYGDRETFSLRPRAFVLVPAALAACVAGAVLLRDVVPLALVAVFAIGGAWNVWHTLMQRYGLFRIYAARAGGGLETRAQGRLDLALLWATVAIVATSIALVRPHLLLGHPATQRALELTPPLRESTWAHALLALVFACWLALAALWVRAELRAHVAPAARAPRPALLASTLSLFAVFVVSGPIVGYLAFGAAHALEYVAFVHHVAKKKYSAGAGGVAAAVFQSPRAVLGALVLLPLLYLALSGHGVTALAIYVVYDVASATTHFVFDGWIWKVRKPTVAGAVIASAQ